jgi:hypothetical protein
MYRSDAQLSLSERLVTPLAAEPQVPDEVDALFLGDPAA